MAGRRQPVELLLVKGRKHMSKAEIKERQESEVKAPSENIRAPSYLPKELRRDFKKYADQLKIIGIMSELDVDALARYLTQRHFYLLVTDELLGMKPRELKQFVKRDGNGNVVEEYEDLVINADYSALLIDQDRLFKQCRQAASDLGLTITSRCRLVIPKKQEEKKKTRFDERFGDV